MNLQWLKASITLLEEFKSHGGKRAVLAGTCAEYDWTEGYCLEDTTRLAPTTLYGTCKHALQLLARAFADQTELSLAWGRIFFLYGPHEKPHRLVPYVVQSLLSGKPALCTAGDQVRDFLYVADAAAAFAKLLSSEVTGVVNIASGQGTAVADIVHTIADITGRRDLLQLGALPTSSEPPFLVADTSRLNNEVGWLPAYSQRERLVQTVEWWRRYGSLGDKTKRGLHNQA